MPSTLTTVTPATNTALATRAYVKGELGIADNSEDARIDAYIRQASDAIVAVAVPLHVIPARIGRFAVANARNILCRVQVSTGDYTDLGGVKIADLSGLNCFVKAATGSADLYVAVVNGSGTPTYTASGIRLRVGIL